MKIDHVVMHQALAGAEQVARRTEDLGFDGLMVTETRHDPFSALVLAAEHSRRLELGTAVAIAFARSPMTTANVAWDLQRFSNGRFMLGLGSQIRPHVENRFSMPWSQPVERMREFVCALHAIWDSWQNGSRLDFRGDFYTHTLMTPFFDPGPNERGAPNVFVAGLGERMTQMAAEVGDGLLMHALMTDRYLREVTLPAVEMGLALAGRSRARFQVSCPVFVVTGRTEEDIATSATLARRQLAFYASTPAYRTVLERHGWVELQTELNTLSKQTRWEAMGDLIDDEMLGAFAVVGEPESIADQLLNRFDGLVDRLCPYLPVNVPPDDVRLMLAGLRPRAVAQVEA